MHELRYVVTTITAIYKSQFGIRQRSIAMRDNSSSSLTQSILEFTRMPEQTDGNVPLRCLKRNLSISCLPLSHISYTIFIHGSTDVLLSMRKVSVFHHSEYFSNYQYNAMVELRTYKRSLSTTSVSFKLRIHWLVGVHTAL